MRYLLLIIILVLPLSGLAQDAPENVHDYYRATRERILAESAQDLDTLFGQAQRRKEFQEHE